MLTAMLFCPSAQCAEAEKKKPAPSQIVVYKTVKRKANIYKLKLHIFNPPNHKTTDKTPCIVLFHSGGWASGDPSRYYSTCKRYSSLGAVAISVEYSIRKVHNGTPFDSVTDGKSAIRWVRAHAKELGVNPDMIAAGGASAGGQVAAAAAHLTSLEEKGEDLKISSKPNALILVSPVFDNGPGGYGHNKVKSRWKDFSPIHNVRKGAPPTLVFVGGDEAKYIRVESAKAYKDKMKAVGSRCELIVYDGQKHGYPEKRNEMKIEETRFLKSLNYLK